MNKEEVIHGLREIVTESLGIDDERLTDSADLIKDLGGDSLDLVEIIMEVEETFGIEITDDEAEDVKTFANLQRVVLSKLSITA